MKPNGTPDTREELQMSKFICKECGLTVEANVQGAVLLFCPDDSSRLEEELQMYEYINWQGSASRFELNKLAEDGFRVVAFDNGVILLFKELQTWQ